MSSAQPTGHPEQPSGAAAAAPDPALAAAVRIQRRRHRWAVAFIWSILAFLLFAGSVSSASQAGTPAPTWFDGLMDVCAGATAVTLGVVIGHSITMRRQPAEARAQAIFLERQRLRRLGWGRRAYHVFYWTALWLGLAIFGGCALIGVPWVINGAAYLVGAGPVVRWSAAIPIHSDGDAAGSLVIGLLFIFMGVLLVFAMYKKVTRVWWPRYLQRRAGASGYQV
jgi:hypothetical protein